MSLSKEVINPAKLNLKEQVTPHKLSLLVLIKDFCVLRKGIRSPAECVPSGPVMPGDSGPQTQSSMEQTDSNLHSSYNENSDVRETQMTKFMLSFLKLIQSCDVEPQELLSELRTFCSPELYRSFLSKTLSIHDEGLQSMMNFFQSLTQEFFSLTNPLAEKSSVVGRFVRRLALCFDMMTFSQVTSLFCAFKSYCKVIKRYSEDQMVMDDSMDCAGDVTIPEMDTTKTIVKPRGRYSARQAELFILQQSHQLEYNPSEALRPIELQNKLDELIAANPNLADVHYLSYLNHLRVNEYCGAVHSLYHYFDRNQFSKTDSNKDEDILSRGYRYAILNLASLHFRFGHHEEALLALEEAMRVAHEYNDQVCLQHTLSWFNRLGIQMPLKSLSLEKSVHSTEPHVPYLSSLNAQVMSKRLALNGTCPAAVLEGLIESNLVNCQHDLTDLTQMNLAQKSAVCSMYGNRLLPSLYSQCALNLVSYEFGVEVCGEATCIAMCTLARAFGDLGHYNLSLNILNKCRVQHPEGSTHSPIWRLTELILLFDQSYHTCQYGKMMDIVEKIHSMDSVEGRLRKAVYLKEIGDTAQAVDIITVLRKENLNDYPAMFCRLTLIYTELCCQIGNPVGAIDSLVSCLVQCKEKHLLYHEALTSMYLGYVQFCLSLPEQAVKIIEENMVTMLNLGSNYDKARCLYLYARCRVAASKETASRKDLLQNVRGHLNESAALFQSLGNSRRLKDVYYYQARLCHELGSITERNKFAIEFKKLDILYPTITQMDVNIL